MNGSTSTTDNTTAGALGPVVRKLVALHTHPSRHDGALSVVSRLLDSSLSTAPSMQTAEALTRSMIFRLMRDGRSDDANKLASLTATLRFERALSQDSLWPILYVLNELRGYGAQLKRPKEVDAGDPRQTPGTEIFAGASSIAPELYTTRQPEPFISPTDAVPDRSNLNESSEEEGVLAPNSTALRPISKVVPVHQSQVVGNTFENRSLERGLLQDLLLIVQGDQGHMVYFEGEGDDRQLRFNHPSDTIISLPTKDMCLVIAELGFLYTIVRARIAECTPDKGPVELNLCRAIERELDNYFRSLVTLRGPDAPQDLHDDGPTGLTLRRMFVWSEAERIKLRWLARLCDETRPLHGGQVVAHLRLRRGSYVSAGIRDIISRIVSCTAAPVNRMLVRWLAEGVIADPHGEFFIMEDPKVAALVKIKHFTAEEMEDGGYFGGLAGGPNRASAASNRIWWGLFKLRPDRFPGCVDKDLAEKTLIAGKSVAFMRRCCSDAVWVDENHAPMVLGMSTPGTNLFEADLKFEKNAVRELVEKAKASASKRLKELFFDRFDLSHHFGAIKQYLLLSQGDFAQALMVGLAPLLDGDGAILRNNLTSYVDAALLSCSSFNESTDQDILERLDVKIESVDGNSIVGWDVFSLTYRVDDAPLNTVFSPKVMDAYLLIFRLLWRLKRVDYLMSMAYSDLRETDSGRCRNRRQRKSKSPEHIQAIDRVMKKMHYLRMKMTHLVHNMQHYCTVEVLQSCWAVLEEDLTNAEDLDGMIMAHSRYLTLIKDRTLLSERSQYVAEELSGVLDTIPAFSQIQKEACKWAVSGRLRTTANVDSEIAAKIIMDKLSAIEKDFDERFALLLEVLEQHSQMIEPCEFLLFRLDFNKHYHRKGIQRQEGEAS